jgi:hypothetical protein
LWELNNNQLKGDIIPSSIDGSLVNLQHLLVEEELKAPIPEILEKKEGTRKIVSEKKIKVFIAFH